MSRDVWIVLRVEVEDEDLEDEEALEVLEACADVEVSFDEREIHEIEILRIVDEDPGPFRKLP